MKSDTMFLTFLINAICNYAVRSQIVDDVNLITKKLSALDELITLQLEHHFTACVVTMSLNYYNKYLQILIDLPVKNEEKLNAFEKLLKTYPTGPRFLTVKRTLSRLKRNFKCSANTITHIKMNMVHAKMMWIKAYQSILNQSCPYFTGRGSGEWPPIGRFRWFQLFVQRANRTHYCDSFFRK